MLAGRLIVPSALAAKSKKKDSEKQAAITPTGRSDAGARRILTVMADPSEGEALTDAGNDLVATVPMPAAIIETIDSFIAEHNVERPFTKRQRDRCESQIPGHRG